MSNRTVCICVALFLSTTLASAQSKLTMTGKCAKPDVQQSISVPDMQGHSYGLSQGKCTAEGKMGSAAFKDGVYSEHLENTPKLMKNWGVFSVTVDSGDKIYFTYQGTDVTQDGKFTGGTNRWMISGGTGKMSGMKGVGTCKLTPGENDGISYNCTGTYGVPGAAAPKQ